MGAFSSFFAPDGASHSCADWPATPSGCKLLVPRPSGATGILLIAVFSGYSIYVGRHEGVKRERLSLAHAGAAGFDDLGDAEKVKFSQTETTATLAHLNELLRELEADE